MKHLIFTLTCALSLIGAAAHAATLGLTTTAPTITAQGDMEYIEFAPDGDLSLFSGPVLGSSLAGFDLPSAELEFIVSYTLADPGNTPSGGFALTDVNGDVLAGDLLDLGFRAGAATDGIVELHFENLTGTGAADWTDTLLMEVTVTGAGADPLAFFSDGAVYATALTLSGVSPTGGPAPNPIPLPAGLGLLLGALTGFGALRRGTAPPG